jgi:hypothetical protein
MKDIAARARAAFRGMFAVTVLFSVACGSDATTPGGASVASIKITFLGTAVSVGAVQDMSLAFLDNSGHVISGKHEASWTSSNSAVASVDGTGNVRGVALGGPVTITANADGKSASTSLSVIPAAIAFTPIVTTLLVGTSTHLMAAALDAAQLPITAGPATWTVSPSSIASVDDAGVVTALAAGTITVSATIAGRVGTTQILAGVPSVYDGVWTGPILAASVPNSVPSGTVQFTVIYGTVMSFLVSGFPYCAFISNATTTVTVAGSQSISDNQFLLTGQGSAQITDLHGLRNVQTGVAISGAFTGPTAMTGFAAPGAVNAFGPYVCPDSSSGNFGFRSNFYSATKQ